MALGHIGTFDYDAVRIREILERSRSSPSSEGGPQTGDRRRVSNAGLIFYLKNAECGVQLLEKIVLFVVPSCATKMGH
jgi:hypothetical protein